MLFLLGRSLEAVYQYFILIENYVNGNKESHLPTGKSKFSLLTKCLNFKRQKARYDMRQLTAGVYSMIHFCSYRLVRLQIQYDKNDT